MSLNRPVWRIKKWISVKNLNKKLLYKNLADNYKNNQEGYIYQQSIVGFINVSDDEDENDKFKWLYISLNDSDKALDLLKANPDKIYYAHLCLNKNPKAIKLLRENPDKIFWTYLSLNSCSDAIKLLKENPENIYWKYLSKNSGAVELLKANPNNIDWTYLSSNPSDEAIELLKANPDKINWNYLSSNPAIYEYDYEAMKNNNQVMYEELIKEVLKPSRVFKYYQEGNESNNYDYLEELFGD